jgi:hypothetical protein
VKLIRHKMRNVLLFSFAFVLFSISLIVVFNFILFVSSQSIKGHVVEGIDQYFFISYLNFRRLYYCFIGYH